MKRSWPEASTPWSSKIELTRESTRDLGVDVGDGVGEALLLELALDDLLLVLAQQLLGDVAQRLTWSETASACSESSAWAVLILSGRTSRWMRSPT